jgi:glycosyltransferase involved in cell wall biosynthesis
MSRKISVAIPHYNNSEFMKETLQYIVNDDRINEIIICDDCSTDFIKLQQLVSDLDNYKVVLMQNEKNLGCYHNKLRTVSKCNNEWAILLDSDNIINKDFVDTIFNIEIWDPQVIFAPMWSKTFPGAGPNLNYSEFKGQLIDKTNYLHRFDNIVFQCLINACNYFLPVKKYSNCMNKYTYNREIIDSLDSAVLFTDWLCDNCKVLVVDGLVYSHRLHPNSNYMLSESKKYTNLVNANLVAKIKNSLLDK